MHANMPGNVSNLSYRKIIQERNFEKGFTIRRYKEMEMCCVTFEPPQFKQGYNVPCKDMN